MLTEFAKDLVYPPACPVCGEIIPAYKRINHYKASIGSAKMLASSYICDECVKELHVIGEMRCRKCGKPLSAENLHASADMQESLSVQYVKTQPKYEISETENQKNKGKANSINNSSKHSRENYVKNGTDHWLFTKAGEDYTCRDCTEHDRNFEQCHSTFIYDDTMSEIMAGLKYHHRKDIADSLSVLAYDNAKQWLSEIKVDIIVPVPVHEGRLKERGYNQAEVLATLIGKQAHIPVAKYALVRSKSTKAQKELGKTERMQNLSGAFSAGCRLKNHPTVLLIDDIFTTGATAETCTDVLLSMGAGRVYVMCIAAGVGIVCKNGEKA